MLYFEDGAIDYLDGVLKEYEEEFGGYFPLYIYKEDSDYITMKDALKIKKIILECLETKKAFDTPYNFYERLY